MVILITGLTHNLSDLAVFGWSEQHIGATNLRECLTYEMYDLIKGSCKK